MATKPPYHKPRKGQLYFEPTAKMRLRGWANKSYGPDGSKTRATAWLWWDKNEMEIRFGNPEPAEDPAIPGSMAEAWRLMTGYTTEAGEQIPGLDIWEQKGDGTRKEWIHVWEHWIKPEYGDVDPETVTIWNIQDLCSQRGSKHQIWRLIKFWRAFWKIMGALQYVSPDKDPSRAYRRPTLKGRPTYYVYREVSQLVKAAWRAGDFEMAAIIAVMWDTQFMPVDVRTLVASQRRGKQITRSRAKTGVDVIASLSHRTERVLDAYLAMRDAAPIGEARLFTYSKSWLSHRFTRLRRNVFGETDKRTMLDIRRSGAVEATAGNVDVHALSKTMGNSYKDSQKLQETYAPSTVLNAQHVLDARRIGRSKTQNQPKK